MKKKLSPPVSKADWIAALRSGKYAQANGILRVNENDRARTKDNNGEVASMCCLGVYCALAGVKLEDMDFGARITATISDLVPGFAKMIPADRQRKLANMNDARKSFLEIADRLERWK